ncbi:MAG: ankyrin repeat domain-containing protein [Candidatus Aminicenantales bacterium]
MKIEDIVSAMTAGIIFLLTILICGGCRDNSPLVYSTIQEAAEKGDLTDVRRHIRKGVDVNDKDYQGYTPLLKATLHNQTKVAEYLITRGADVNTKLFFLRPLSLAIQNHNKHLVKALLAMSADVNIRNDITGFTPLHEASDQGDMDIALLLISYGAEVNSFSAIWHETPLHLASSNGNKDIAHLLISQGADVNALNGLHFSPCQLADFNRHMDVVELLRKHGARICDPKAPWK